MKKVIFLAIFVMAVPALCAAQDVAATVNHEKARKVVREETKSTFDISTNLFDWADFGTVNLDLGVAVSRHLSVQVGAKYNPWQFEGKGPISLKQNQQKSASVGLRYWPWYVYSGWWICAKAQYCDYAETGIWRQAYDAGKALGGGLSAGYTLMVSKHFNIELGAGLWGGRLLEHTLADCPDPDCMANPRESGPKNFIAVNDLNVSFHWVF